MKRSLLLSVVPGLLIASCVRKTSDSDTKYAQMPEQYARSYSLLPLLAKKPEIRLCVELQNRDLADEKILPMADADENAIEENAKPLVEEALRVWWGAVKQVQGWPQQGELSMVWVERSRQFRRTVSTTRDGRPQTINVDNPRPTCDDALIDLKVQLSVDDKPRSFAAGAQDPGLGDRARNFTLNFRQSPWGEELGPDGKPKLVSLEGTSIVRRIGYPIILHELGHLMGLGDTYGYEDWERDNPNASREERKAAESQLPRVGSQVASVMRGGGGNAESPMTSAPTADDVAGLAAVYRWIVEGKPRSCGAGYKEVDKRVWERIGNIGTDPNTRSMYCVPEGARNARGNGTPGFVLR